MDIYRQMSGEQRVQIGFDLSAISRSLQTEGIRTRHPEYTEDEIRLALIRINLGDELFRRAYPDAVLIAP